MKDTYLGVKYSDHKFSGKVYQVGDSTLTILGKLDRIEQVTYYSVKCSNCSKDTELYPENIIVCPKSTLDRDGLPCGCASRPKWSDYQKTVLAKRRCKELGIFFKNIIEDKVCLEDEYGVQLTTSFESFKNSGRNYLNVKTKDGHIFNYRATIKSSENQYVLEQLFHEIGDYNKKFLYCDKNKVYYFCSCDTCREYSRILKYSPIFSTTYPTLRCGNLFCWSVERRFVQEDFNEILLQLLKSFNASTLTAVVRDLEDTANIKGIIYWVCGSCGKERVQKLKDFWDGYRCKCINTCLGGFYPNRLNEDDHLYFIDFFENFSKIGRSFDLNRRLASLKAEGLCIKSYKVLKVSKHIDIFKTEQDILKMLRSMGYTNPTKSFAGRTEAFIGLTLDVVEGLIND